ncbi:MAG: glycoside hydrolase family 2 protein [Fimbriimonadales bacterium]
MPLLDPRAQPLTDWTLAAPALGQRLTVRVPSAWEDYGIPRLFEGPCDYLCTLRIEPKLGKRYWLHCSGVSYEARGFVNEIPVGVHKGIWDSFSWDITDALRSGENTLRLQVVKNGGATYPVPQVLSGFLPYVSSTFGGVWQPVHLYETGEAWLDDLYVRGDADGSVRVEGELGGASPTEVSLTVYAPDGQAVYTKQFKASGKWTHEFQISSRPQPWHPHYPNLYRLAAEVYHRGILSHRVETEFGLRTVAIDGSVLLLNGEPFYPRGVLHWGWYLHTHAPYPDLELAEREIKAVQLCGFNLLKACLWVPSREYLQLCDRLGIAVWLELPLWLPDMHSEQVEQVKREYEAIVRQVRNHPSILLWTLGCELSTRFPSESLGELYALVKRLTGSPLVRDNSGGGECYGGTLREYADFADYHLYGDAHFARTTFRAFLEMLREPTPWIQGEFADHDTQRDFRTLRQTVPPEQLWWLERDPEVNPQGVRWFYETPFVEERMQHEGIWDALPDLIQTSRKEMVAYHKLVLETMRSLPQTSGYVVTGLKDTPISTAGILDERSELKISPESYTEFNTDTVLLLDWHRRREWIAGGDRPANPDPYNHFGGCTVYPRIAVSHFGTSFEVAELLWRLSVEDSQGHLHKVASGGVFLYEKVLRAGIHYLAQLEVPLPSGDAPQQAILTVELRTPSHRSVAVNRWRWGIYPIPDWTALSDVVVYDPAERLWGLPESLTRFSHETTPHHSGVVLTSCMTPALMEFFKRGGVGLWLVAEPTPLLGCERLPFWREAAHRFLSHPLWEVIPRPEYLDERLFAFGTDLAIRADSLGSYPLKPIWQRVDTRTGYTHSYLAEVQVDAGKLMITTLHFAGHHGDTPITLRYHPAGQYWLWAMLRYLASR